MEREGERERERERIEMRTGPEDMAALSCSDSWSNFLLLYI